MILTSMTYKEMYDHLAANLPKIQFKMNMLFQLFPIIVVIASHHVIISYL